MTNTTNLSLPNIEAAQAQKHVTHNDALRMLDALVQLAVLDRDLTAPPESPAEGQRWIVKAGGTGAWAGHDNAIAAWQDGGWDFYAPQGGWLVYVLDETALLVWSGTAWIESAAEPTVLNSLALLGIGTTADTGNPFSARLNGALFVAKPGSEGGTGDVRLQLSKETASQTASIFFSTNFSGRAEFGLTGSDSFALKVSADGVSWKEAFSIDPSSGIVSAPSGLSGGSWGEPVASWSFDTSGAAAAIDFSDLGSYRELLVIVEDVQHNDAASQDFLMRVSNDNGVTYRASTADYNRYGADASNGWNIAGAIGQNTPAGAMIEIQDFNVASRRTSARFCGGAQNISPVGFGYLSAVTAETNNALRLTTASDVPISGGAVRVYGKK